jgi:predicted SprT family Zn-dependent metalloprotease
MPLKTPYYWPAAKIQTQTTTPRPARRLCGYEYHCGGCVTSFFNERGHQIIQRNGAWCEQCEGELILIWQPGDPL